jgi:hypothetical protein
MIKVSTFSDDSLDELEQQLNGFFSSAAETIELVDLKYAIAHKSVATTSENGVYSEMEYTVLVVYRELPKPRSSTF